MVINDTKKIFESARSRIECPSHYQRGKSGEYIRLTKRGNGMFFTQNGNEYNLYKLPRDGHFEIRGNLDLSNMGLKELPDLSMVSISGDFVCSHNPLTSLQGCPKSVGGDFVCEYTDIADLRGAPRFAGSVYVSHNRLTSLRGAPMAYHSQNIFDCGYNHLISLKFLPMVSDSGAYHWDYINCNNNQIRSLKDLDMKFALSGVIDCANNRLTRLEFDSVLYTFLDKYERMPDSTGICKNDIRIEDFSGNPCFENYARWLLKHRGISVDPNATDLETLRQIMTQENQNTASLNIVKSGIFLNAFELRDANREMFDNNHTFGRGVSRLTNRARYSVQENKLIKKRTRV